MADFVAVNGIRTTGESNIDRLTSELVKIGHNVVDLGLPVIGAFEARKRSVQMENGRLLRDAIVSNYGRNARVRSPRAALRPVSPTILCSCPDIPIGGNDPFAGLLTDNVVESERLGALVNHHQKEPVGLL